MAGTSITRMSIKLHLMATYYWTIERGLLRYSTGGSKAKNVTAKNWVARQQKDPYVKRARYESYRCRSAFKLLEIDDKHRILKPGDVVIDCGAAPGSWSEVAVQRVNSKGTVPGQAQGKVISVDLLHMLPVDGALLLHQCDFTSELTQRTIVDMLDGQRASVILSDMAPNATGIKSLDHEQIVELCEAVWQFSLRVLNSGGVLLCKLWQGADDSRLKQLLASTYSSVRTVKPKASRSDSAEIFLLAKDFRGSKISEC